MAYTFARRVVWGTAVLALTLCLGARTARAQAEPRLFQLELGAMGGGHFFASDLELGVADDPSLPSPKSSGLFGLRLGLTLHPMIGVEIESVLIPTADNQHDYTLYVLGWRAHVILNLLQGKIMQGRLTPFVLAGAGFLSVVKTEGTAYDEIKKDTDPAYHVGVGARYRINQLLAVRVDGRVLAVPNTSPKGMSADFELMAGLSVFLGGRPLTPPPPPPPVEAPPPPPPPAPVDTDGDGITDDKDKCPTEAEDKDGFQDDDGCPDPDNDADGIPDDKDKCPNEAEDKDGFQDDDGCPDEVPAAVAKFTGVIKGINFKRNSADIRPSSFAILKKAVQVLKDYPTVMIEISGHTSDEGKRDFNMKLSKERAEAVKAYLVSAGATENRISTVGYGPDKPIADNKTRAGKEKNRRIEFRLVSQAGDAGADAPAPPSSSSLMPPTPEPEPKPVAKPVRQKKTAAPGDETTNAPEVTKKRGLPPPAPAGNEAAPATK
ncbi:MAG TPA: OmpA family protein [Polyangia bacterium]|nr:OmpA family protein [Polyangia bacterium]